MAKVASEFPADVPDQPELVLLEREGDLVWLTIQRPEVMNCLSFPTLKRLRTLCEELREDLAVRSILITGAGEKAFCAGADLKERKTMPKERVPEFVAHIRRTMDDVEALPQPTIAVVNGFAFGGGTELLLACDLRVAAAHAQFGLTETTLAIIPGAGPGAGGGGSSRTCVSRRSSAVGVHRKWISVSPPPVTPPVRSSANDPLAAAMARTITARRLPAPNRRDTTAAATSARATTGITRM